jgi:hypothetical protein
MANPLTVLLTIAAGGVEIIHPGERWAICRDSEGTPFGLVGSP